MDLLLITRAEAFIISEVRANPAKLGTLSIRAAHTIISFLFLFSKTLFSSS